MELLFANKLYPTGLEFYVHDAVNLQGIDTTGIVLVIPGRYWYGHEAEIAQWIAQYQWVLAIKTGDEEDQFDVSKVKHPNIKWWVQTPRTDRDYGDAHLFGVGFPPHFNDLDPKPRDRILDVFLSAQKTHVRRQAAFTTLSRDNGDYISLIEPTKGFTQGMKPDEYALHMTVTKVAPAPSGAFSPDSFRVYEALEAHAVPIADDVSPVYDSTGYWAKVLPGTPFPVLTNYVNLPGYIRDILGDYPRRANRVAAWWMKQKRTMTDWLYEDLLALGAIRDRFWEFPITVIITTSPIKSHPSTRIIEETVESVRKQLPDCEIILVHDGVREEQEDRRSDYEEYIRRVLWLADHHWKNVLPLVFDEHLHQAVSTKRALEYVRTPLLLFVEGDTPLTDGEIDWHGIVRTIINGDANLVRFSHESHILDPHKYLMLDDKPQDIRGVPMIRTVQWSQRPHLAALAFYRDLLDRYFPHDEKNFIEDVVYGKLHTAYNIDGVMGWHNWRTWIYHPEGNIQRSYHTDGREGEDKYDR
ncbi:hypothetical protein DVS77_21610 [Mycolicibacterium moriokaense]|nr:hypothetical protein DVS77_21610 [Mycolicibacterium moriokaense]